MKSKNKTTSQQFETYIGIDLGDMKHHVCVTDKHGVILEESIITNDRAPISGSARRLRGW
jgi:actin-like ATPase involved in cell morphogenesis